MIPDPLDPEVMVPEANAPLGMDDDELIGLIDGMIDNAIAYDEGDRSEHRRFALEYQKGEMPDLPTVEGKSSVVSQDLADAISQAMPGLMRVFLSSDKLAVYEPERPDDEEFAEQATDYVNYVFMRECNGEELIRDTFHDGLLLGNGIVKHWWDPTPEYDVRTFTGLDEGTYYQLLSADDVEVLEYSAYPASATVFPGGPGTGAQALQSPPGAVPPPADVAGSNPPSPGDMAAPGLAPQLQPPAPPPLDPASAGFFMPAPPPMFHDVKVRRVTRGGRLRVMAVADEDFLIESAARSLDEKCCRFVAHRDTPTRSELLERGYDYDTVWDLPGYSPNQRIDYRRNTNDRIQDDSEDKASERVEVFECYALVDYDGDGHARWMQVILGGNGGGRRLLSKADWGDDLPFTDIVPDPMPHRWRGRSFYDQLFDVQRVKTVLIRSMLDNLYLTVVPNRAVNIKGVENPEALIDLRPGDNIYTKGDPNTIVKDLAVPFVAAAAQPIIDYMDKVAERRTGIGDNSAGLDLNALQNQSATAVNAAVSATGARKEDYARNISFGMRRLFRCLLKIVVQHQDKPRTIRLRNDWVQMDPRSWNANMDVTVNTGLGSGNRDRDLAMLQGIATKQEMVIAKAGPVNPICGVDKLTMTYRMMVEAAGIKSPERFFPEIKPEDLQKMAQPPAPQQNPAMMKAQADIAANGQKMQAEMQLAQQKAQADAQHQQQVAGIKLQQERESAAQRVQLEREKAAADIEMSRQRHAAELELMQQKAAQEFALKRQELQHEAELKALQMQMAVRSSAPTNIQEATP